MAEIEEQIVNAIVNVITTDVPEIKFISADKIRLAIDDFQDHEIPAVQLWDVAQTIEHQRGRILVDWSMSLEIITKSLFSGEVSQKDLWALRRKIQLALWNNPNLLIPRVVHLIYTGNITDLHVLEPFYIARIDFIVRYYDDLTGSC